MGEHRMRYFCALLIYTQCLIRISAQSIHETEGKSCETPRGESGLCLQLPQCRQVLGAIEQGDRQHTRCGFLGSTELVCCKTESSSPRNTYPTTTFQSSALPLHRDLEAEYSSTSGYMPINTEENQANSNPNSESRYKFIKFLTPTEASIQSSSEERSDSNHHLNEVETDTETIDSRIFLGGNNDRRLLSPLFPLNTLKNIVSGILTKPTRTPKINLPLITTTLSKPFHYSETDTEKYYTSHTTPRYDMDGWPVSTLKPKQTNPSTSLPLLTTTPTSIFDIIPNEILQPETRPVPLQGKNENPSWTTWDTNSSPSPKYDLDDNTPPYYFPLRPSPPPEETTEENQSSTSPLMDLESLSPTHGMSDAIPKESFLPNSHNLSHVTTEETTSFGYGTSFQVKPIDETTISNVLLKPTQSYLAPTWMSINHNPTTESPDTDEETPSFPDFWYPIERPDLEIPSSSNWPPEEEVRPEMGITSEIESSKNLTWRKSQQACAKYKEIPVLTKYIVGGDYAAHGEFPHMVALGFQKPREANLSWLCGGTLLNEEFVLTAAHCVKTRYGAPVALRVGFTNLTADWSTGLELAVGEAIAHPRYDPAARAHDIALLRVASPLQFSQFVLPACLRVAAKPPPGPLTVTGWGSITPDGKTPTDHMKKALVTPTEDASCREFYPKVFRQEMICAGNEDPVDTCQGDSGGPMQLLESSSSIYMIVGITSFGPNPCASERPGVYTRVASYVSWIEDIVWPDFT